MQRPETTGAVENGNLGPNLSPPVRLDLWALLVAVGIVAGVVAGLLVAALILASLLVAIVAALRPGAVPEGWRMMALIAPLFLGGGVGIAYLHVAASDPLLEFASVEPGEVVVGGRVISAPVPTKIGYRADVYVEHLWYEEKEVLRGGGV